MGVLAGLLCPLLVRTACLALCACCNGRKEGRQHGKHGVKTANERREAAKKLFHTDHRLTADSPAKTAAGTGTDASLAALRR